MTTRWISTEDGMELDPDGPWVQWNDLCRAILHGQRLEKALRKISDLRLQPIKASDPTEVMAQYAEVCEIARAALGAELDDLFISVKPGDSPFPQPPLEPVEKGLGRDREIPGKEADA